jgi:hypothetical protein
VFFLNGGLAIHLTAAHPGREDVSGRPRTEEWRAAQGRQWELNQQCPGRDETLRGTQPDPQTVKDPGPMEPPPRADHGVPAASVNTPSIKPNSFSV